jgi:hypothetical protein
VTKKLIRKNFIIVGRKGFGGEREFRARNANWGKHRTEITEGNWRHGREAFREGPGFRGRTTPKNNVKGQRPITIGERTKRKGRKD